MDHLEVAKESDKILSLISLPTISSWGWVGADDTSPILDYCNWNLNGSTHTCQLALLILINYCTASDSV